MADQKVCPICGKGYPEEETICTSCKAELLIHEQESEVLPELENEEQSPAKESGTWMYRSALVFPLAEMLLSAAKVAKGGTIRRNI